MEHRDTAPEPYTSLTGAPVVFIETFSVDVHGRPETLKGKITYHYADGTRLTIERDASIENNSNG